MTLEILADTRTLSRPNILLRPLQAISALAAGWKESRRRKADMALLMSMDPHVLQDIGVSIIHTPYDGGSIVSLNPAVIATTMHRGFGTR